MRRLVLGSTSRYRRELLERLRLPFTVVPPEVDETPLPGEAPAALAPIGGRKGRCGGGAPSRCRRHRLRPVADLEGEPLGKPGNHANAVAQLRRMRGRVVVFQTALTVMCAESGFTEHDPAPVRVRFRSFDDAEIEAYLRAEQPYDCAGSAKSEGLGIALLESIESDDPTALIGLPLIRTSRMLRAAGLRLFA
ncbi:septum formation inhibitor Maf [Ramlibacter terrae]|uniref:Nucleoside triphosphate pyrophosphatase n=1 Tax=Ramlibacter terrae TaxID=2732511 RepID=A0ABX6P4J1_9BURK|nr:septum formation inhibitor Maf [Ramlibacter terrae]